MMLLWDLWLNGNLRTGRLAIL